MTRLVKVASIAALMIAGIAFAMGDKSETYTWRYKITVTVETPEGEKSGATVREVKARIPLIKSPEAKTIHHTVIGEAVPINLGIKGWAFALVDWDSYEDVYRAFPTVHGKAEDTLGYYSNLKTGTKADLKEGRPRVVIFKDVNDPVNVKLAYSQTWISQQEGYKTEDHFSELLGSGFKLKNITIEMTDDPVTSKIDQILPQFGPNKGFNEWQKSLNYGSDMSMERGNFHREEVK